MPLVNVRSLRVSSARPKKRDVTEILTEAMVAIEGENMRQVTWVIVEEVRSGDWAIGGTALTTADVKALAAGAPVG